MSDVISMFLFGSERRLCLLAILLSIAGDLVPWPVIPRFLKSAEAGSSLGLKFGSDVLSRYYMFIIKLFVKYDK